MFSQPLISLWRNVFIMIAAVYAFGALVFVLFGSGREQPWAKGAKRKALPEEVRQTGWT